MKSLLTSFILFFILFSGAAEDRKSSNLREFRNIMLKEVNFLRTSPADYAEKRLKSSKEEGSDNGAYKYLKEVEPAGTLVFNSLLNSVSLTYAEVLANLNKFSHTANGTPFSRAKAAGYVFKAMAENIACGNDPQLNVYENPRNAAVEFVKMLVIDKNVKDLGHRHTLLNPVYKSVGFGFGHNPLSSCVNYVVQDFGNP